jgi:filamentous hemagglutinin family protein
MLSRALQFTTALTGALVPVLALANPEGGVVAAGAATITSAGSTLTINQSTDRAVIDWRSFNIAPNETTRFVQPSSSSHTLNRVNDTSRSVIEGTIAANGNITIVNPNGVFFSRGSTVDVAGLTATSAGISNANFMAGRVQHNVAGNANAKIINEGNITVRDAGLAAFVAPGVENNGTITARLGKVKLAAGETFTLDMAGDGLMQVAVSADNLRTQVANSGMISADGGSVMLTTTAARNVVDSLITNTGVIEAKSIGSAEGKVVFYAEGSNAVVNNIAANKGIKTGSSTVIHSGSINVSGASAGERGGKVEVLADNVALTNGSLITASGHSGGGDIKVGGDYLGGGTTAAAKRTFVQSGARITNNATHAGNGGRSIFWSDDKTQFAGSLGATSVNGVGGFTEVSGKNMLGFTGSADLRSQSGTHGTLLLDPTDITISSAADTGTMLWDGTSFTDIAVGSSNLNVGTLTTQLGLSNVIVSTASAQGGAGNITVSNAINWASNFALTLLADNNITLNAAITNTGLGGLTLTAGGDGAGNIDINSGANINVGGALMLTATGGQINRGNIADNSHHVLAGAGVTINSPFVFTDYAGWSYSSSLINAKTGTLTINGGLSFANVHGGWHQLSLQGDDFAINNTVSWNGNTQTPVSFSAFSVGRQLSLAGAVGGAEISTAELDFVTQYGGFTQGFGRYATAWNTYSEQTGDVVVSARNWATAFDYQRISLYSSQGAIVIDGNQNIGANGILSFYGDVDVNATIAPSQYGSINFYGKIGQSLTVGGAAGTTMIDSDELDLIGTSGYMDFDGSRASAIDIYAYNNWRSNLLSFFGNGKTITIHGTQAKASGASSVLSLGASASQGSTSSSAILINADVDFSSTGNGAIILGANAGASTQLGADLLAGAGGISINHAVTLTGGIYTTRSINAGTGTLSINNDGVTTFGSINAGNKNLTLTGDNMILNGAIAGAGVSAELHLNRFTAGRSVGLAGGAGDLNISAAELNNMSGFGGLIVSPFNSTGTLTLGAYDWSGKFADYILFQHGTGTINVTGAQTFATNYLNLSGDMNIAAAISNAGGRLVFGRGYGLGPNVVGGSSAGSWINSTELNFLQNGFSLINFSTDDIDVETYANWRDPILFSGPQTLNINGAQTAAAGSDASFELGSTGGGQYFSTINVNANIDMSATSNGTITLAGKTTAGHPDGAFNLAANLIAKNGITIDRAVTLVGAAGTTRTINAGIGILEINTNGTTQYGSIMGSGHNIAMIADSMAIGGSVYTTQGDITLRSFTNSRSFAIGDAATGDLRISDAEWSLITTDDGSVTYGSNGYNGAMDINIGLDTPLWVVFNSGTGTATLHSDLTNSSLALGGIYQGIDFYGNTRISGNRSITMADGNVRFFGPVNGTVGGENLTVASGGISFGSAVGAINALGNVSLTSQNALSLGAIRAASLFAQTMGATADITLNGQLALSGTGTALELVSGDDIINSYGAGVFNLTGGGRFLTWSDDPLQDTGEEHFSAAATKRYNRNYGVDTPEATGNIRNYSVAPTLTITPNATQVAYGDATVSAIPGTYTLSGWHMAEDQAAHTTSGSAIFQTSYAQGNNAGTTYTVTDNGSTLSSGLGYGLSYAPSSTFTVNKANLRVKAVDIALNQGDSPVVTFLYEPSDFKLGQNAGTAGITGAPTLVTALSTLAAGTHNMVLNLAGLSATNYNFTAFTPRGVATVNGTGGSPAVGITNIASSVLKSMGSAEIMMGGSFQYGTLASTSGSNTSKEVKSDSEDALEVDPSHTLYDKETGESVVELINLVTIDPLVKNAFGLTETGVD